MILHPSARPKGSEVQEEDNQAEAGPSTGDKEDDEDHIDEGT